MPESFDLVVRARRAIVGNGSEAPVTIGVIGGRIAAIRGIEEQVNGQREMRFGDDTVLLPGLVDTHVHICEPGNTEWEGFASATRAAAAGGVTTLVDMPLDSVPTTVNVRALEAKRRSAEGQCHVDVGFWGGAVPGNAREMAPLCKAGVLGFKCFMVDSGSPDFPPVSASQMEEALNLAGQLGVPLLVHAESQEVARHLKTVHGRKYARFLASRPRGMENLAVAQVVEAARRTGAHAHVVHLSSSDVIPMLASARHDCVRITAESCPHYLSVAAEEIEDGATTFKCAPPIREATNRELLWCGLRDGHINQIVSDHSPCTVAMKHLESGDFGAAWAGITSLQLGLPVVWTEARRRGVSLAQVARWMSQEPAQLAGLARKGRIAIGFDADLCIFAPDESFVVDQVKLLHRHPITPYAGRSLIGVVRSTILRGELIDPQKPRGRLLSRDSA